MSHTHDAVTSASSKLYKAMIDIDRELVPALAAWGIAQAKVAIAREPEVAQKISYRNELASWKREVVAVGERAQESVKTVNAAWWPHLMDRPPETFNADRLAAALREATATFWAHLTTVFGARGFRVEETEWLALDFKGALGEAVARYVAAYRDWRIAEKAQAEQQRAVQVQRLQQEFDEQG
jgi:hypothetical protein